MIRSIAHLEIDHLAPLYSRKELEDIVGLCRSRIYDLINHNDFPKPVKIGARRVAWVKEEVMAWQERINQKQNETFSQESQYQCTKHLSVALTIEDIGKLISKVYISALEDVSSRFKIHRGLGNDFDEQMAKLCHELQDFYVQICMGKLRG